MIRYQAVLILLAVTFFSGRLSAQESASPAAGQADIQRSESSQAPRETPAEASAGPCAELQQKLDAALVDRDNILVQMKLFSTQKNKFVEEQLKMAQTIETLNAEKDALTKKIADLEKSSEAAAEVKPSEAVLEKPSTEAQLRRDLEIAERVAQDLIQEVKALKNNEQRMTGAAQDKLRELQTELDAVNAQRKEWQLKAEEALKENAELRSRKPKEEASPPASAASTLSISQERDRLLKENADLHYNLGVFLAQKKDFVRAVNEFERAVALFPNDASAHFNLAKIYADQLDEKEKAVAHFQQYLQLEPNAPDKNWVLSYIDSSRAWQGEGRSL